jgi:hypothetical protein
MRIADAKGDALSLPHGLRMAPRKGKHLGRSVDRFDSRAGLRDLASQQADSAADL